MQDNAPELIDKKELGRRINLGKTAIESLQRQGIIPYIKWGNSRRATVRYDYPQVLKALSRHQHSSPLKPIPIAAQPGA